MISTRRKFLTGLGALIAAPAIVRVSSLMPVKAVRSLTHDEIMALLNERLNICYEVTRKNMAAAMFGTSYGKLYQLDAVDMPGATPTFKYTEISNDVVFLKEFI